MTMTSIGDSDGGALCILYSKFLKIFITVIRLTVTVIRLNVATMTRRTADAND